MLNMLRLKPLHFLRLGIWCSRWHRVPPMKSPTGTGSCGRCGFAAHDAVAFQHFRRAPMNLRLQLQSGLFMGLRLHILRFNRNLCHCDHMENGWSLPSSNCRSHPTEGFTFALPQAKKMTWRLHVACAWMDCRAGREENAWFVEFVLFG